MPRSLRGAIASAGVTLTLMGAAELSLRALGVEPQPWPTSPSWRPEDRGLGSETPPWIEVDPLFGPLPKPGWSGPWFSGIEVEIDKRGFRSTGFPPPASPRARVAFLGDSCTFGWGVGTRETYVSWLDAIQRTGGGEALELVNGGYPGDSAVQGYYKLRDRILTLQPDVIVLAFSGNNAFRLALRSHAEQLRLFRTRRIALRSRLVQVLGAWVANARTQSVHPRDRDAIAQVPLDELRRVASEREFEGILRKSVAEARASGARVLFLLLPRAMEVTDEYAYEDPALSQRALPLPKRVPGAPPTRREIAVLENSCLDNRHDDALDALHRRITDWQAVRPQRPEVRAHLHRGAVAWESGEREISWREFSEALRLQPDSPLALYDLGVVELESGNPSGMQRLVEADRLACSVFLKYQVAMWRVATQLNVPVVDAVLLFQAHEGEALYLDPAHPSPLGHRLIAEALWPVLERLVSEDPAS